MSYYLSLHNFFINDLDCLVPNSHNKIPQIISMPPTRAPANARMTSSNQTLDTKPNPGIDSRQQIAAITIANNENI